MSSQRLLGFRKSKSDPLSLTVNDVVMWLREFQANGNHVAGDLADELTERANKAEKDLNEKIMMRDSHLSTWTMTCPDMKCPEIKSPKKIPAPTDSCPGDEYYAKPKGGWEKWPDKPKKKGWWK